MAQANSEKNPNQNSRRSQAESNGFMRIAGAANETEMVYRFTMLHWLKLKLPISIRCEQGSVFDQAFEITKQAAKNLSC